MKYKKDLKTKLIKGEYKFFLKGKDITKEWMWFFSGLSTKEESNCVNLFIKSKFK